jgi:hypothetical protein
MNKCFRKKLEIHSKHKDIIEEIMGTKLIDEDTWTFLFKAFFIGSIIILVVAFSG